MRVETLLPLGKVDPGLRASEVPFDIHGVAQRWEEIPARISDEVQNLYATVGI